MKETTARAHQNFVGLYDSVKKTISFMKEWQGPSYSLDNAINHVDRRLMLVDGEMARSVDRKGRRVVFIGTIYGLVAIYETCSTSGYETVAFDTTHKIVAKGVLTETHAKDLSEMAFSVISSESFRTTLQQLAVLDNDPGDGLKVFEAIPHVKKKKYPPRRPNKTPQDTDEGASDNTYALPA